MKRFHILIIFGAALAMAGYFVFPALFQHFQNATPAKHVNVSTAKAAAIHIATSDPRTTLLVFEEKGAVSITVTKTNPEGDYVDGRVWIPRDNSNLSLLLSRRQGGVLTIMKDPDADGLPTRKSVGTKEGVRSYRRREIEWIELPR